MRNCYLRLKRGLRFVVPTFDTALLCRLWLKVTFHRIPLKAIIICTRQHMLVISRPPLTAP